jgi:hypothetical protein
MKKTRRNCKSALTFPRRKLVLLINISRIESSSIYYTSNIKFRALLNEICDMFTNHAKYFISHYPSLSFRAQMFHDQKDQE